MTSVSIIHPNSNENDTNQLKQRLLKHIDLLEKLSSLFDTVEEKILDTPLPDSITQALFTYNKIINSTAGTNNSSKEEQTGKTQQPNESSKEIYKRIAQLTHPDKNIGKSEEQIQKNSDFFIEAKNMLENNNINGLKKLLSEITGEDIQHEDIERTFQNLFRFITEARQISGINVFDIYKEASNYVNDSKGIPEIMVKLIHARLEKEVNNILQQNSN